MPFNRSKICWWRCKKGLQEKESHSSSLSKLSEFVGRVEASKFTKGTRKVVEEVSHCIYRIMSNTLGGVQQMVSVLPTREVTQLVLDRELAELDTATFPDPCQELLRTHYIRADRWVIEDLLQTCNFSDPGQDDDKVIVEVHYLFVHCAIYLLENLFWMIV